MKLKMKMKTLIISIALALFLILIIAPIINLGIANYLSAKGSPKSEIFYKSYMASPVKINKTYGIYSYGESLVDSFKRYQIQLSGWGGESDASPEDIEKAAGIFEKILLEDKKDEYKSIYSYKSYVKLLDISIARSDPEGLLEWIEWGEDKANKDINQASQLYKAYYYYAQRDYERSKEILDNYEGAKEDPKYYHLLSNINLHQGDIQEARKVYRSFDDNDGYGYYDNYENYFGGNKAVIYKEEIQEYLDKYGGEYKVRGKVSHDGKGLAFVEVYIDPDVGSFKTGGLIPDAITDENGEFETAGLKQGVYETGIALNPSQVYDKTFLKPDINSIELNSDIDFNFEFVSPIEINNPKGNQTIKDGEVLDIAWEPVEGADYYKVEAMVVLSGASGTIILEDEKGNSEIKTNNMKLDISKLKKQTSIMYYSDKTETINPSAIFGSFIPGTQYPIIVDAYDKKEKLIGSSLEQIVTYENMSSITSEKELTKGEKLILDSKYEKAVSLYQEQLKDNPKDKEALLYLFRLYSIGWKMDEQDTSKALKYAQEYDKEYKDYDLLFEAVDLIGSSQMKENKELIEEILEKTPEKDRDDDYYYNRARYYVEIGNLTEARDSYDMIKEDSYGNIAANKIYIDIYLEDYDKAISTLENEDTKLMFINTKVLIKVLENIDSISNQDKLLFKNLLKAVLDNNLGRKEMNTLYKNTLKKMDSKDLKKAVSEIAKEEYFEEYYEYEDY